MFGAWKSQESTRKQVLADAKAELQREEGWSERMQQKVKNLFLDDIRKALEFSRTNGGSRAFQMGGRVIEGLNLARLQTDIAALRTASKNGEIGFTLNDLLDEGLPEDKKEEWRRAASSYGGTVSPSNGSDTNIEDFRSPTASTAASGLKFFLENFCTPNKDGTVWTFGTGDTGTKGSSCR
jgi:hypothetical protein